MKVNCTPVLHWFTTPKVSECLTTTRFQPCVWKSCCSLYCKHLESLHTWCSCLPFLGGYPLYLSLLNYSLGLAWSWPILWTPRWIWIQVSICSMVGLVPGRDIYPSQHPCCTIQITLLPAVPSPLLTAESETPGRFCKTFTEKQGQEAEFLLCSFESFSRNKAEAGNGREKKRMWIIILGIVCKTLKKSFDSYLWQWLHCSVLRITPVSGGFTRLCNAHLQLIVKVQAFF